MGVSFYDIFPTTRTLNSDLYYEQTERLNVTIGIAGRYVQHLFVVKVLLSSRQCQAAHFLADLTEIT